MARRFQFLPGPGMLVTAAFIGPGTVTVCMQAGIEFKYTLLWAMLFSVIATIVLQEMAARLGLIAQKGLGEAVLHAIPHAKGRKLIKILIGTGILIGNAAFEGGNLTGTALGLKMMTGNVTDTSHVLWVWGIVLATGSMLWFGNYRRITGILTFFVFAMSAAFMIAAFKAMPDLQLVIKGVLNPSIPEKSLLVITGLIGTTVVPYNLFLHAALVKEKWTSENDLSAMRRDNYWSIGLGGIISVSILITGATVMQSGNLNMEVLAHSLEPVFGKVGIILFGFGFFAAGFTSAITAPLAAALVAREIFSFPSDNSHPGYRITWATVLIMGALFASTGYRPVEIISLAQFANGLLLPFIAVFLYWTVNQVNIMGAYRNSMIQNALAVLVIAVALLLGMKGAWTAIQLFAG